MEETKISDLPPGPKAFVSFELFEHLHSCQYFLECLIKLMQPGDLFLFTTLSSMGVDIQALWQSSNSISLQHLNFFNPKSIKLLLKSVGLSVVSVETPGKLDFDILFRNKALIEDRFWRTFISSSSQEERDKWQMFLAEHGFSSHMFVVSKYTL